MTASDMLPYGLCASTGAGAMLTLILLVWHCFKFHTTPMTRLLKYSVAVLLSSYILTGFSITLLILHKDLASVGLCKTGGFFLLFSTQETLWMLATTSAILLLRSRHRLPWRRIKPSPLTHRWSLPIFAVILITKAVILGIFSSLPLTDIQLFDSLAELYYTCTPLRLPGEKGWGFSTVILILNWCAVIITVVCISLTIRFSYILRKTSTKSMVLKTLNPRTPSKHQKDTKNAKYLTTRIALPLSISAFCWIIMLVILSVNYFSRGAVIDRYVVQWILGYFLSIVIVLQPVSIFLVTLVTRTRWFGRWIERVCQQKSALQKKLPPHLDSVIKMESDQQGVCEYSVKWRDKSGSSLLSGSMKVYHPSVQARWVTEATAARALQGDHPNIVQYHWESPTNCFLTDIAALTGDSHSPHSSIVCHASYPHGTLSQFLDARVHRLTDIGLHKLSLDIASGLDYLHHHNIVHNNLRTSTVYMASVSDKIGLRAVIGNLERSYQVNLPSAYQSQGGNMGANNLFSVSSDSLAEHSDVFARDVEAFGMLLLEIMMAMSNWKQQKRAAEKRVSDAASAATMRADITVEEQRVTESPHSAFTIMKRDEADDQLVEGNHVHVHGKSCTCSKKVTQIRVCHSKKKTDKLYLNAAVVKAQTNELDTSSSESLDKLDPEKVRQIQRRKLPPIPVDEVNRDAHSSLEEGTSSGESPNSSAASPDHSPSNSLSSGKSSDSLTDDHYNASSIGSLGSFDTIYEDEEQKSFHSGLSSMGRAGRRYASKPAIVKRKASSQQTNNKEWQKKRMSASSFDDSVVSSDSGVGSSHYDVETGSVVMNHPGNRDTIYSSESLDGDRFSLLMSYLGQKGEVKSTEIGECTNSAVLSHHSAPAEITSSEESTGPEVYGDFGGLPDLRIRKKPCRGDHPHFANGPCCHLPPAQSSKPPVPVKPGIKARNSISKRPMPLPSEKGTDPIYEKISSSQLAKEEVEVSKTLVHAGTNTGDSLKKRGVLVVHDDEKGDEEEGRSLDVASIVSMVQQGYYETDHKQNEQRRSKSSSQEQNEVNVRKSELKMSQDNDHLKHRKSDRQSKKGPRDSASIVSQDGRSLVSQDGRSLVSQDGRSLASQDGRSVISVASSHTSDCCSKCGSNLPSTPVMQGDRESRLSISSRASSVNSYKRPGHPVPKLGVSAYTRRVSTASLASSHRSLPVSITQPNNRHTSATANAISGASHRASTLPPGRESITSSALSMINDCNLIIGDMERRRSTDNPKRSHSKQTSRKIKAHKAQLEQALVTIKQQGNLGFTAGQLLPLLSECCTEGPSTQHILARLQQVLPTASV